MKSIIIKNEGSVTCYTSGWKYHVKENGEHEPIEETEEEQMQTCYQQLISDIKRKEFDETMKSLILNHVGWDKKDCNNICIKITGKDGRYCEMNISVTFDWNSAILSKIDFPDSPEIM